MNFTFLSPEYILVPRFKWRDDQYELVVISTKGPFRSGTYADLADTIFDLPELAPGARCSEITINAPAVSFSSPTDYTFNEGCRFTYDADTRMVSLVLFCSHTHGWLTQHYRVFVPAVSLLQCLHQRSPPTLADASIHGDPPSSHARWEDWGQEARFIRLTANEFAYSFDSAVAHRSFLSVRPSHNTTVSQQRRCGILDRYDFPSVMQMRRESKLSSGGPGDRIREVVASAKPPSSAVVSVSRIDYHLERVAVEDTESLWAHPVFSAPYRRTGITVVLPHDYSRYAVQLYALSEDGLVFADPNR